MAINYVAEYHWDGSANNEDKNFLNPIAWQQKSGTHYYQDGKYILLEGDGNQSGWGSRVPPGYEKIGHVAPEYGETRDGESSFEDPKKKGPGMLMLRRIPAAPPPAAPAPAAAPPPVIEPKQAETFDPAKYQKTQQAPEAPRVAVNPRGEHLYELNTKASAYENWLADRNNADTASDQGSDGQSLLGGDRARRFQGVVAGDVDPLTGSGGDRSQRMAGSERFQRQLDRYRR